MSANNFGGIFTQTGATLFIQIATSYHASGFIVVGGETRERLLPRRLIRIECLKVGGLLQIDSERKRIWGYDVGVPNKNFQGEVLFESISLHLTRNSMIKFSQSLRSQREYTGGEIQGIILIHRVLESGHLKNKPPVKVTGFMGSIFVKIFPKAFSS